MPREALSPITNTPHTPARRLSSKFVSPSTSRQVGLSSPSSVLTSFADDDEGQQRKQLRRRSQGFELHRKNLGSPRSNSPRANDSSSNGLSSTELANNYSDCIKLSAENKITAKNAFGLHLIDYMTVLLKKKELENFQVASSTLDASVKIYAGRVDFIHNHAYKVLSGLGGTQKAGEDNEDGHGDGEGESVGLKKKKKVRKGHTTETNLKNINVDKFDLAFEVDPMFQIMSAAFDEGGAKGLLLNRLNFFDNSQHLVLDSSTPVNLVEDRLQDSQDSRKPVDVAVVQEMLNNLQLDKEVCPSMSDFQFTNWNGESSDLPSVSNLSEYAFDPNSEPQHLPSVEEEAEAIAHEDIEDLDNAADDHESNFSAGPIDSISGSDMRTAEFVQSAFTDLSSGNVGKLRQILALEPTDYSYFNKILMGSWAGPAHWNMAAGTRSSRPTVNAKSTTQTKRTRKAPLRLTYDTDGSEMDKMFTFSKCTSITKQTWSKYSKKKTTLPDDQQMDTQDKLFKLFHKPNIMIKRQLNTTISDRDDDIENYDYNNKNDVENFCPVARDDDDDDIDNSSEGLDWSGDRLMSPSSQASQNSMSDLGFNGTILTQDKMVAAPNRVQKIDIRYAKAAKRVDVKKLKTTMWSILSADSISNASRVPIPQQETVSSMMSNAQTFSSLKDIIPVNVPSGMAKNLTIQTVFACLLYLTNEKTLKLSSSEHMDDIQIQQDDSL